MKNEYSNTIEKYVEVMKKEFKEELEMLLIIGSSCSNKVIPNWSDIDSILVIKDYNFDTVNKIKKVTNSFDVKIGTTIYSKKEFELKKIDPKTIYHLYLVSEGDIKMQYKVPSLKIPEITKDEVIKTHELYLDWRMHMYKRLFLYEDLDKEKIRNLYKTTYLIMKAFLIKNGYKPKNYEEVFKLYSENFDYEYFDYEKFISDYKNDNEEYKNIIQYAQNFILEMIL